MTREIPSPTEVALAQSLGQFPRVSEILEAMGLGVDYSHVPPATLELAKLRGTALHLAIQYHAEGVLDETTIHEDIAPGFSAYLKFLAATRHEPIASEIELIHPVWRYVGHPDRIGFLGQDRVVIDFKYMDSVDVTAASYQVAAYQKAWDATHPTELIGRCAVLQLRHDGTYRLHEIPTQALTNARQVFLAALVVFRARRKNHER